jgi:hypothetical protein
MHCLENHHTTQTPISIDAPNSPVLKPVIAETWAQENSASTSSTPKYCTKCCLRVQNSEPHCGASRTVPNEAIISPSSPAILLLLLLRRWAAIQQLVFLGLFKVKCQPVHRMLSPQILPVAETYLSQWSLNPEFVLVARKLPSVSVFHNNCHVANQYEICLHEYQNRYRRQSVPPDMRRLSPEIIYNYRCTPSSPLS